MKEEIKRTLEELEKNKWITINENLNHDALAAVFIEMLRDMPVRKALQAFSNIFE